MKKIALVIGLLLVVGVVAFSLAPKDTEAQPEMMMYKSPSCGCCNGWASYMGGDFDVNVVQTGNTGLHQKYDIPQNMWSCHTSEIEGYFIEGHMPQEAIDKLLEERPDIDGIALPGMPSGSPGMPGAKSGTWTIYAIKDGEVSEFMTI